MNKNILGRARPVNKVDWTEGSDAKPAEALPLSHKACSDAGPPNTGTKNVSTLYCSVAF